MIKSPTTAYVAAVITGGLATIGSWMKAAHAEAIAGHLARLIAQHGHHVGHHLHHIHHVARVATW